MDIRSPCQLQTRVFFEVFNIVNTNTGCTSAVGGSEQLNVIPLPISMAGPDIFFCPGDTVSMGAPVIFGANYLWTNSAGISDPFSGEPDISLENFTGSNIVIDYELITTINGCSNSDTVQVTVFTLPSVDFLLQSGSNFVDRTNSEFDQLV